MTMKFSQTNRQVKKQRKKNRRQPTLHKMYEIYRYTITRNLSNFFQSTFYDQQCFQTIPSRDYKSRHLRNGMVTFADLG